MSQEALGAFRTTAAHAHIAQLDAMLGDTDQSCRAAAAEALGRMHRVAAPHAAELRGLLHDPDMQVRFQATKALEKIEP